MSDNLNQAISRLAYAIAHAEGFFIPLSIPARCNNPGDLEKGDIGLGTERNKTIFKNPSTGWLALELQIEYMLNGKSRIYAITDTIEQVAAKWTGNDNAAFWAWNVATTLGIKTTDPLSTLLK